MAGTWINVIGIVLGSVCGLIWNKPLSTANQLFLKLVLGIVTVFCGLRLVWISFHGTLLQNLKLLLIAVVAMGLGRLSGRLLRLQNASNHIGQFARRKMEATRPNDPNRFSDGFAVCGLLFCAAPLGILGALSDGLSNYFYPLAIKAVMDGLGAMAFATMFGVGVTLSAVPVLVFQGTLSLLSAKYLLPFLESHQLLDSITATSGLLIFTVSLIIFEIKKIEVTDYLPSLIFAPLLAHWLR